MNRLPRYGTIVTLLLALQGGPAAADTGVIDGCYDGTTGALRIVHDPLGCKVTEVRQVRWDRLVRWEQQAHPALPVPQVRQVRWDRLVRWEQQAHPALPVPQVRQVRWDRLVRWEQQAHPAPQAPQVRQVRWDP